MSNASHREVSIGQAPALFFKNYANFQGRSSRGAYWWWTLVSFIIGIVLNVADGMLFQTSAGMPMPVLGLLFFLATLLPGLALGVRRLHDTGKSGWWLLIALVPLAGAIALIVFFSLPGKRETLKYGEDVEAGRA